METVLLFSRKAWPSRYVRKDIMLVQSDLCRKDLSVTDKNSPGFISYKRKNPFRIATCYGFKIERYKTRGNEHCTVAIILTNWPGVQSCHNEHLTISSSNLCAKLPGRTSCVFCSLLLPFYILFFYILVRRICEHLTYLSGLDLLFVRRKKTTTTK
jgi:hypothetical protein